MSRFKFPILLSLALAAVVWTAAPLLAAGRGGRGGGGRGGYGGRGYGGYGGRGYGGYGGYGYGGYGFGYGGFYPNAGYGYGYGGYSPSYTYDYGGPAYVYPDSPVITTQQSGYYSPPTNNSAGIRVRVPSDATVWMEDERTQQTGPMREFLSPPLTPGSTYEYHIKARWMENGTPVERTKTVKVRANETTNVDFVNNTTN